MKHALSVAIVVVVVIAVVRAFRATRLALAVDTRTDDRLVYFDPYPWWLLETETVEDRVRWLLNEGTQRANSDSVN